jgi:hypothetical protein
MPSHVSGAAPRTTASTGATPSEADLSAQTRKIARFVERLHQAGFYGKVTLSLQNGHITDVRTEQTRKLDDL